MEEITWYSMKTTEDLKLWRRTFGITDGGDVFMPAAVAGSEQEVLWRAAYDGIRVGEYLKHAYVPVEWMRRTYPSIIDVCDAIEGLAKDMC